MNATTNATRTINGQVVEIETRNRKAGVFLRLSMKELQERTGCVALSSHPFTLAVLIGDQVAGVLVPHGNAAVRWATIATYPGVPRPALSCLSAEQVVELRAYGQRTAADLTGELVVFDHTSLRLILGETA